MFDATYDKRAVTASSDPQGEGNALLKNWRILREPRCCPWRVGQVAKAIHTLEIHMA